jgi:hypothetical protein
MINTFTVKTQQLLVSLFFLVLELKALVLIVKEHESSFEVISVVMKHLVIKIEIVDEVTDEKQIVGFERRQISHAFRFFIYFLRLNFFVTQRSPLVGLTLSICNRRQAYYRLISLVDCQSCTVESGETISGRHLILYKSLCYLFVYDLAV